MNIFVLDTNPMLAARFHCNKHIVKMPIETAQILSTTLRVMYPTESFNELYKATHINHPASKWARESWRNFVWLYSLGKELCFEYTFRYERTHKCENYIDIAWEMASKRMPENLGYLTPFALCMPNEYKTANAVESYRTYYLKEKRHILKYTRREPPEWVPKNI